MVTSVLYCECLKNPVGIDSPAPRLSWSLSGEGSGEGQKAYRVLVASDIALLENCKADLWDSGYIEDGSARTVIYDGLPLKSNQVCWWIVKLCDQNGTLVEAGEPNYFQMGLLQEDDWKAQWIRPKAGYYGPMLRKAFSCDSAVRRATAYISGLGYAELEINGRKVSDHVLDPLFSRYDKRCYYVAHDVTEYLTMGGNAIGVMLGTGWYDCHTKEVWNFETAPWRDRVKLLFQLVIEYVDGTAATIVSDGSWRSAQGPITFDGLRKGEAYDARLERPGWSAYGYDDSEWRGVEIVPGPGGYMASQRLPMRVTETIRPASVNEVEPGVWIFDMAQSFAGWVRLKVEGPSGTQVTVRYAEKLKDDGSLDQSNIDSFIKSGRCQTDTYILKGRGLEIWEPRFTYHGFRYVEVTGYPGIPTLDSLEGRVVHTDFETAGTIETSSDLLNAIQHCTLWSFRSNFHGIPTDCPHREKNGWTGDAQLAAETGLMNFDTESAYEKWMDDFADVQRPNGQLPGIVPTGGWGFNWGSGPAWDSAYIHIPWYLYLYRGNRRVISRHYDGMKRYLHFMGTMATDNILTFGLGDWCPPDAGAGDHECPTAVTSTGYYYANARIMSQIAGVLGLDDDSKSFSELASAVKAAFNREFYDKAAHRYAGGSQTAQACALYHGLVDDADVKPCLDKLIEAVEANGWKLNCGILGTKYLFRVLARYGRADAAYRILMGTDHPSYGFWIKQGATTLWEDWEGKASRNHIMFGDISAWMFSALAGIEADPEAPGFRHTFIKPQFVDGLQWVKGVHNSPYGRIESGWCRREGKLEVNIVIPPGVEASVILPNETGEVKVGSGTHRFVID